MKGTFIFFTVLAIAIHSTVSQEGVSDCVDNGIGTKYAKMCYLQYIQNGVETKGCVPLYEDEYQDIKQTIEIMEDGKGRFGSDVKIVEVIDCSAKFLTAASLALLLLLL